MDLVSGATLARTSGECDDWSLSVSDSGELLVKLGGALLLGPQTGLTAIPAPPGELVLAGLAPDGRWVAAVQGEHPEHDFSCQQWAWDGQGWQALGEPEGMDLNDGCRPPFCQDMEGFAVAATRPGGVQRELPDREFLDAPPVGLESAHALQEMEQWVVFPGGRVASLNYAFEGHFLTAPVAHRVGGQWAVLPDFEGNLWVALQGERVLVCDDDSAALIGADGTIEWSGSGFCPAFKPAL